MRRSKVEIYLHLVWSTWHRGPLITAEIERALYRTIEAEVRNLGCTVLALGGTADHVHVVVRMVATVRPADLAKQMKGVSSAMARDLLGGEGFFRWQAGYGVFSLSRTHVSRVITYVRHQKERHDSGRVWPEWEETDQEAPAPEDSATDAP